MNKMMMAFWTAMTR